MHSFTLPASLLNPYYHLQLIELGFRKVKPNKGYASKWVGDLGSDLRSLSNKAILHHWALLVIVRQVAQLSPHDSMWAFTSAACDELSKRSETCDSHLGFSGPMEVHQGNQGHLMLFSKTSNANVYYVFPRQELAQINSEHEPLPRQVKAVSYCLSFECRMTLVSLLWACWLFPRIRR